MPGPREALLDKVIDNLAARGLGTRSLRDIAEDVGTSHRMLIHHFGSREGLLVAIVAEVEARERALAEDLPDDPALALSMMWERVADSSRWSTERLFFECYARGTQGEPPFDTLVPGLVDSWLERIPEGPERDRGRLGLAVIRGLLLDLVATEDRAGTDRALGALLELMRAAEPAPR